MNDFDKRSISNTGKPVVVKAPTMSTYASIKLMFGKIIHDGNAKNNGNNKNSNKKETTCITPVSFKFLLDVAKYTRKKTSNPAKPVYKKIRASLNESMDKAKKARMNIKLQERKNT